VDRELSVVVAGEYKQGKSSLVNAIVKTEVCPVDDDIVTAVPTIVRYGEQAEARIHLDPRQVAAVDVLAGDDFVRSEPAGTPEGAPGAPGVSPSGVAPPPAGAPDPATSGGDRATGQTNGADGGGAAGAGHDVAIPLGDVPRYIRGEVEPSREDEDRGQLRSVEVRLPRQVLRAGLSFVDSPGVGGLESAEGSIVLGVLDMAEGLIFVTDASQELTRAEVSFLQAAVARCPKVACVVTKTDLHADWRRMVELDREHLRQAGLGHIPVMGVTSFLRMRAAATNDTAMNDESGFPALFEFLRSRVVTEGRAAQVAHANAQVAFAARELERGLRAESAVIARPEQADHVVERLADASRASAALQASNAPWQQVLNDGIQDLVANVDHDLRNRLKAVVRAGEDIIARTDPASSWSEFEAWLRRQVVTAAVETYDYMATLTAELTERVGRQFQRDSDDPIALSIAAPVAALEKVQLGGEFSDRKGLRSSVLLSAARGSYGGMLMFGMAGSLLSVTVAAPVMLLLSLGLGRRSVREELKRHHQQNQAQARAALQRYAGEVGLLVDKECKDALRRTQRQLRDEFTARARSLHQSATDALATAQRARRLDPDQQAVRHAAAAREIDELGALAQAAPATRVPAPVGGTS
jgi:hypothetical protein